MTCFALAYDVCPELTTNDSPIGDLANTAAVVTPNPVTSAPITASPVTSSPAVSPVNTPTTDEPTEVKVPTVPTLIMVCGEGYSNAVENICVNEQCPSGEVSSSCSYGTTICGYFACTSHVQFIPPISKTYLSFLMPSLQYRGVPEVQFALPFPTLTVLPVPLCSEMSLNPAPQSLLERQP